jgi:hypothetical protein
LFNFDTIIIPSIFAAITQIYFLVLDKDIILELSGEADAHLLLVHGRDGLDLGGAVEDLLAGAHDPLGHAGLLEAHHDPLGPMASPALDNVNIDLAELLEELIDDDKVIPAGKQLLGLQQDLVGKGVLGGLHHPEVHESVER